MDSTEIAVLGIVSVVQLFHAASIRVAARAQKELVNAGWEKEMLETSRGNRKRADDNEAHIDALEQDLISARADIFKLTTEHHLMQGKLDAANQTMEKASSTITALRSENSDLRIKNQTLEEALLRMRGNTQ